MNRLLLRLAGAMLALGVPAGTAFADGPPRASAPRPVPAAPFTWTGLYLGPHLGGALDRSDISNPYGQTLFGDEIRSPGTLAGGQIGYNWQHGALVVGVESDVSWADLDGTFTCLQPVRGQPDVGPTFIGGAFGATCRAGVDWLGTLTGRVGAEVGPDGRRLLYAKGGLAWMHGDIGMATNNIMAGQFGPPAATSSSSFTQWGWTVGTGLEYALAGNWSARLEYDFLRFGSHGVATPLAAPVSQPDFQGIFQSSAPDGRRAGVEQDMHAVKLALNYRFGGGADPRPTPAGIVVGASDGRGMQIEVGGRYVHGWGRFQQDLAGSTGLPSNNSRLTWKDLETDGGEVFWRIDTPHRLMVKGLWGTGSGDSARINDEDWGIDRRNDDNEVVLVQPYQNTVSPADNKLKYFTIDLGYNLFEGPGYKFSPYVGYSHFRQSMSAFGLTLINFSPPQVGLPANLLVLQEFASWDALRLGTALDVWLAPRLRLNADAAYLPYVHFDGVDNHPRRTDAIPSTRSPQDGDGRGVQLEATLSYYLTDRFSVGVGGRYWATWIPVGETNFFSSGEIVKQRFAAEQAALFVQGSYKFDLLCCGWPIR
jgi:opacity protein-like surface antigen